MVQNIERFFADKTAKVKQLQLEPILLKWLKSPGMGKTLAIIDRHVEQLRTQPGGQAKLEQWLLSDDRDFNAITAERYIISYLRQKNLCVVDNLCTAGIDARLALEDGDIGIEITTLNGFIADWILIERLSQYFDEHSLRHHKGYEIIYSHRKIQIETQGNTIYKYIQTIGDAVVKGDTDTLDRLEISITDSEPFPGVLSFRHDQATNFPWYQYVTTDLAQKLKQRGKQKQFAEYRRNIVFVGVNHTSPPNGVFPYVFEALSGHNQWYKIEADAIREFWSTELSNLSNVLGICFFLYAIDSDEPFYPLTILWRGERDKVNLVI